MSKAMRRAIGWTMSMMLLGIIGCSNNGGSSSGAPASSTASPADAARAQLRHSTGQYYVHDRGISLAHSPAPATAAPKASAQAPAAATAAPKNFLQIPALWTAKATGTSHPAPK